MRTQCGAGLLLLLVLAGPLLAGTLTISEVFYDASGTDDGKVFVEIWGKRGTALTDVWLEGINGANGSVTHRIDLSDFEIPSNGFFVVADSTSDDTTSVNGADLLIRSFDLQNGPDAVRLVKDSKVLDALGYGTVSSSGVFGGEGTAASDVAAGKSLARWFANVDTDDNFDDFRTLDTPTPGKGPVRTVAVPTPEAVGLGALGLCLVAMVRIRRRYSLKQ